MGSVERLRLSPLSRRKCDESCRKGMYEVR